MIKARTKSKAFPLQLNTLIVYLYRIVSGLYIIQEYLRELIVKLQNFIFFSVTVYIITACVILTYDNLILKF